MTPGFPPCLRILSKFSCVGDRFLALSMVYFFGSIVSYFYGFYLHANDRRPKGVGFAKDARRGRILSCFLFIKFNIWIYSVYSVKVWSYFFRNSKIIFVKTIIIIKKIIFKFDRN